MMNVGDTISTSGDVQYIGGIWNNLIKLVGEQLDKILSISIENSDVLNILRCTHGIPPMYSWYPPDVLMVSPRCTHGISPMY